MAVGRNAPCPCGSGKKYKKCCLRSAPDPLSYTKEKLDRYHQKLVEALFEHATQTFGSDVFEEAAAEFLGWPDDGDWDESDIESHEMVFYPWLLFKWRLDPDEESSLPGPREVRIVESYLQSRGRKADPLEREYMEGLAAAPFSFFEITAVEPGKSISLHDLLLDSDHHVLERTASQSLDVGDVIFASVIAAGGIELFGGFGMIPFRPSAKVDLFSIQDMMSRAGKRKIDVNTVEMYDFELRELYFKLYNRRTAPPELSNMDGETLSFHTLSYTIKSPQEVFDALKDLTNGFVSEEDLLNQAEFGADGELCRVEIPWLVKAHRGSGGMENTMHGTLTIDGTEMTCEVNSIERSERLRNLIEEKVPPGEAEYRIGEVRSPESMRDNAPSERVAPVGQEELMDLPEVREQIREMLNRHWAEWPDVELPALQGKTPRQAVRDKLGRKQVDALLEEAVQNMKQGAGLQGNVDIVLAVRKELGLA